MKFRRIAGGLHRFKIKGRTVVVRPGGIIDCDPEVLGNFIGKYEPVDSRKNKGSTPLELETSRHEYLLRSKSVWLNGERPGADPTVSALALRDLPSLQQALEDKTDDGLKSGIPGELAWLKSKLKAAWSDWKKKCEQDPLRRVDPEQPEDNYLTDIAVLQAKIIVVEAEIREIRARIKAAMVPVEVNAEQEIERRRWRGVRRCNGARQIVECDGRAVKQDENDRPVFVDDGQSVGEYLDQCKERALARSRARQAENSGTDSKGTRSARS